MARKSSNEEPIVLDEQKVEQENPVNIPSEEQAPAEQGTEQVEQKAEQETPVGEPKKNPKAPKETPIEQSTPKGVKIHTLEEVDCWVGGNHYQLRKDREFSVPSDVASVLVNARKVYRI